MCYVPDSASKATKNSMRAGRVLLMSWLTTEFTGTGAQRPDSESSFDFALRAVNQTDDAALELVPAEICRFVKYVLYTRPAAIATPIPVVQLRGNFEARALLSFSRDLLQEVSVTELLPVSCIDPCATFLSASSPEAIASPFGGVNYYHARDKLLKALGNLACETLSLFILAVSSESQPPSSAVVNILGFILRRVLDVLQLLNVDNQELSQTQIDGSYNPLRNLEAYYFHHLGLKLRAEPTYPDFKSRENTKEQTPSDQRCEKGSPQSLFESKFFFVFCPIHGHCWGFHIIEGSEGRRDFFRVRDNVGLLRDLTFQGDVGISSQESTDCILRLCL